MAQANTHEAPAEVLLTRREVERRVGLKTTAIYKLMAEGKFPRPVRIGSKAVRWRTSHINMWIAGLPAADTGMAGRLET